MHRFPRTLPSATGGSLTIDPRRVLVAFKREQTRDDARALLARVDLVLEDDAGREDRSPKRPEGKRPLPPTPEVNHTKQRFWARSRRWDALGDEQIAAIAKGLGAELDWIGPVYRSQWVQTSSPAGERAQLLCPLPHSLLVRQRAGAKNGNGKALASGLGKLGMKEVQEKSKYLGDFKYFVSTDPQSASSYEIRDRLLKGESLVADARFEHMPLMKPTALVPDDTLYADQWDMERIGAGGLGATGWNLSTGGGTVVICVLDEGCDLTHPDLQFSEPGINLGTMMPDGAPTGSHGTACAGIAAGMINNAEGVAGVAGGCPVMPVAFDAWTDAEVAAGINYAADNGASVISMSFGWDAWDPLIIDPAIQHAFDLDVVMCVATHNYDSSITYPATNPLVMACGASDQVDDRKSPSSPDGEGWGSNFGPEISVVAPGVLIPTTDRQGADGYEPGDYRLDFNGTSSATPHVAGLAALVRSLYPTLTNVEVRNVIERSAEKVGTDPYATTAGYNNGTWNQEMGYGRIHVLRALDLANLMIRDWTGDDGTEPSSPPSGNFWSYSDIVIRITDDNVFDPGDPAKSKHVERGQTNYLYIQVTNNGPQEARNVVVSARITPYGGLQFVYPQDWSLTDSNHVAPTPVTATFATIPAGASVIAKFTISAAEVESLWGWIDGYNWHPCLLAQVQSDNDYAFDGADTSGSALIVRHNNLAQRNLSVIDVLAGATAGWPMVAGSKHTRENTIELVIDRTRVPRQAAIGG